MDTTTEFLKAIDDPVMDRMKRVVDDTIKQISRNMHNIVKLMRKIMEVCSTGGSRYQSLRDIFKPVKLETWLVYFENLSRKVNNSFADIVTHLQNLLNEEERSKLYSVMGAEDSYSLTDILNREIPVLKEEIAFILNFISYPNKQIAGILEQHQRPDGGTHITSKSISTNPTVAAPKLGPFSSSDLVESISPSKKGQMAYLQIVSRECIDISKCKSSDYSKGTID